MRLECFLPYLVVFLLADSRSVFLLRTFIANMPPGAAIRRQDFKSDLDVSCLGHQIDGCAPGGADKRCGDSGPASVPPEPGSCCCFQGEGASPLSPVRFTDSTSEIQWKLRTPLVCDPAATEKALATRKRRTRA